MLVAPTTPATLFATTSDNVYASRDGGDSWQVVQLPGTTFELGALRLAVSPADAKTVYAMQERQLLRSDDQGQSWRAVGGVLEEPLNAIAVDANQPNMIYAATCGGGVFALRQTADTMGGSGGDGCSVGSPQPFTARTVLAHVFVMALLLARRTTRNGRSAATVVAGLVPAGWRRGGMRCARRYRNTHAREHQWGAGDYVDVSSRVRETSGNLARQRVHDLQGGKAAEIAIDRPQGFHGVRQTESGDARVVDLRTGNTSSRDERP